MKILLVGGTGVLGRATVPLLVAAGHEVLAVSRRDDSDAALRRAGVEPVRVDLFDRAAVVAAAGGADALVNIATRIPPRSTALLRSAWEENHRIRREASANMAEAANAVGARFVQESFAPAYADHGGEWVTEDHPLDAIEQTASILDAEAAAAGVTARGGAGVVLRFGLFYGAGSRQTQEMLAYARRGLFGLPGPANRYTTMIYVDDAAAAVAAALDLPAGVYNVGEDEPSTRAEHCAVLAELLGRTRVRPMPALAGRAWPLQVLARSHRLSSAKLREASGWRPIAPTVREGWTRIVQELANPPGPADRPRKP